MCDRIDTVRMKWADTVALTREDYISERGGFDYTKWVQLGATNGCQFIRIPSSIYGASLMIKPSYLNVSNLCLCSTAHVDRNANVYTMDKYPLRYEAGCGMRAQL